MAVAATGALSKIETVRLDAERIQRYRGKGRPVAGAYTPPANSAINGASCRRTADLT